MNNKEKIDAYETMISQYIDDLRAHTHCDDVLRRHITEFEHLQFMINEGDSDNSSSGLVDLLARHGFESTGDVDGDIEIARLIMPKGYLC